MVELLDLPNELLELICESIDWDGGSVLGGDGESMKEDNESVHTDDENSAWEDEDFMQRDDSVLPWEDEDSMQSDDSDSWREDVRSERSYVADWSVTFKNLCLVNSTLRMIAQPVLVRRFSDMAGENLLLLLRTIAECPRLRRHVTVLHIGDPDVMQYLPYEPTPLIAAIKSLHVEFEAEWIDSLQSDQKFEERRADGILALFLALLPCLIDVELRWPQVSSYILRQIIRTSRIPSWYTINRLCIMPVNYHPQGYSLLELAELAQLLTMPKLDFVELNEILINEESFDLQPNTVSTNVLTIDKVNLRHGAFRSLFEACASLERLCLWHFDALVTLQEVLDLLAKHCPTLKSLDVGTCYIHARNHCKRIDSWDGLSQLQNLSICQEYLTFSRHGIILPPPIIALDVKCVEWDFLSGMEALVEQLDQYKQLTKIALQTGSEKDAKRFQDVTERLAVKNVACSQQFL